MIKDLLANYLGLMPALIVTATAFIAMFIDLLGKPKSQWQSRISVLGLLLAALAVVPAWDSHCRYWSGIYVADHLALIFTAMSALIGALVILFSVDCLKEKDAHPGEFITLVCFVVLGLITACSTKELLTFFVAFEVMSLPLYVMAAWSHNSRHSSEAGYKYFLNGAVASAVMLFGISLIFGSTGSTFFQDIISNYLAFDNSCAPRQAFVLGTLMLSCGLLFKVAAAPFHMWAPDVYEGAPAPAGMFISTAPKAAIIAFLLRCFWDVMAVQSLDFRMQEVWLVILTAIAILSMFWGNLAALRQSNIKRLMAYSGVAQIGYTLLGVISATRGHDDYGAAAAIFYITLYCLANLAAWSVIILVEWQSQTSAISDYRGLAKRSPFLAFTLLISFLSLAGAPPLAGFIGKFFLFNAVWTTQAAWWWVALLGIINSVISLYYYFGVLKPVYFEEEADQATPLQVPTLAKVGIVFCLLGISVISLFPQIYALALKAGSDVPL